MAELIDLWESFDSAFEKAAAVEDPMKTLVATVYSNATDSKTQQSAAEQAVYVAGKVTVAVQAAAASISNVTMEDAVQLLHNGALKSLVRSIEVVAYGLEAMESKNMSGMLHGSGITQSVEQFAVGIVSKAVSAGRNISDLLSHTTANETNVSFATITWKTPAATVVAGTSINVPGAAATIPVLIKNSSDVAVVLINYKPSLQTTLLFPTSKQRCNPETVHPGSSTGSTEMDSVWDNHTLVSPVTSISLGAGGRTAPMRMAENLTLTLEVDGGCMFGSEETNTNTSDNQWTCVWWDYEAANSGAVPGTLLHDAKGGAWSGEGCSVTALSIHEDSSAPSSVTCTCMHLTHFAVLFTMPNAAPDSKEEEKVLDYSSYIGAGFGLLGFVLTWVTFLNFRALVGPPEQIVLQLTLALASGIVLFVLGTERREGQSDRSCRAVAASLHYLLLAGWSWQVCEAAHLYHTFVRLVGVDTPFKWYFLAGWGLPLLFVIPTVFVHQEDYGDSDICCMVPGSTASYLFVVPALCCLVASIVVCCILLKAVYNATHKVKASAVAVVTFGTTTGSVLRL
jgi:hypothetical protein